MDSEAGLLKALADPTRLRLAALLATEGEICVCQLAGALRVKDFKISRHLGILRASGLVATRRKGTWIYYRLNPPASAFEKSLHALLKRGCSRHAVLRQDCRRLDCVACAVPARTKP